MAGTAKEHRKLKKMLEDAGFIFKTNGHHYLAEKDGAAITVTSNIKNARTCFKVCMSNFARQKGKNSQNHF